MSHHEPEADPRHAGVPDAEPPLDWRSVGEYTLVRFRSLLQPSQWRSWVALVLLVVLGVQAFSDHGPAGVATVFRGVAIVVLWFYLPFVLGGLARLFTRRRR